MAVNETSSLLERAKAGDRGAFDDLCRAHRERLESLVGARMGPALRGKVEPADIVQETLLRALQSMNVFRGTDEKTLLSWLLSIAEHLIWNASQKRSFREAPLSLEVASEAVSASKRLRREERLQRLEESLSRLKPEQREAILLVKIEGLAVKEVARRMGRSEEGVRQLISRGVRELRGKFGDTESLHLPEEGLQRGGTRGSE
jgi:RNA polymerase sigma-70 factor (ECF subfamily)